MQDQLETASVSVAPAAAGGSGAGGAGGGGGSIGGSGGAGVSAAIGATTGGGGSVAARLKKMIHVTNGASSGGGGGGGSGHHQQGSSSSSSSYCHAHNGASHHSFGDPAAGGGILDGPAPAIELTAVDRDMVRLLGQHLRSMGMIETVETLIRESGVRLEHPNAAKFRHNVLAGCWEAVLKDLKTLGAFVENAENLTKMKFMVLEQKYLECLEKGRVVEALHVLREELTPLQYNVERIHALSTYLMFNNSSDLKRVAEWEGSSHHARSALMDKLQSFLPASVMLPPRRLEALLKQALEHQKTKCLLHNTHTEINLDTQSLLTDHFCTKATFPCETRQILSDHCDEVWYCQFSNQGRYLATGSKDTRVLIWEVNPLTKRLKRKACLEGHNYGASFFVWSPDDSYLLVVGPEDGPDLWVWDMEKFQLKVRVTHSPEDSLSAVSWFQDGKKFACGGSKGQFYVCDLEGAIVDSWEGVRVRCLNCKRDNKTILASDTHNRIRSYVFDDMSDKTIVKEEHSLMHFTMSSDDRFALCNVANQGVHLWDLETKCLAKRYRGTTQGYYSVFSCFGGINDEFVSSGSEDSNVYIWHRDCEDPSVVLKGHGGVVNAVAWHPSDSSMMASCSDDGTVRIWGPEGCCSALNDTDDSISGSFTSSDDSF